MNCQYPIIIRNPSLKKFRREVYEREGYPPSFEREEAFLKVMNMERTMKVPCGRCLYCYLNRQDEWRTRLQQEQKNSFTSFFVTLTYAPEFEPEDMCVSKPDLQKFLKRLRANMCVPLRYFAISEYGPDGTHRPHYHLCIFFKDYVSIDELDIEVSKSWKFGFTSIGELTDGRIHYVSTYCIKFFNKVPDDERSENFMLCSRRPFIGADYMTDEVVKYHRETLKSYVSVNGYRHKLPRIYRDKIFDDDMKFVLRDKASAVVARREEMLKERLKNFASSSTYERGSWFVAQNDFRNVYRKFKESKKF